MDAERRASKKPDQRRTHSTTEILKHQQNCWPAQSLHTLSIGATDDGALVAERERTLTGISVCASGTDFKPNSPEDHEPITLPQPQYHQLVSRPALLSDARTKPKLHSSNTRAPGQNNCAKKAWAHSSDGSSGFSRCAHVAHTWKLHVLGTWGTSLD